MEVFAKKVLNEESDKVDEEGVEATPKLSISAADPVGAKRTKLLKNAQCNYNGHQVLDL